jgi:hypothetical protein
MDPEKFKLWKARVTAIFCVVAVLWVAGCIVIYKNMRKPPEQFGHFMTKIPAPVAFLAFPFETMWMRARAGTLHIGDQAPDFSLVKLDKTEHIQLSALNREKPVVLVFGSYT